MRILLPREHGTYGECLFPLVAALLAGNRSASSIALALAVVAGFFSHESILVLTGGRGRRAERESRAQARASLVLLLPACAALGLVAAVRSAPALFLWAAWPAVLTACAVALMYLGYERTIAGELLVGLALSGWCLPVALAGGVAAADAAVMLFAWGAFFSAGTLAVRTIIARSTRRPFATLRLATLILVAGGVVLSSWLVSAARLAQASGWIVVVSLVAAGGFALAPVQASQLRGVGWTFMGLGVALAGGLAFGL